MSVARTACAAALASLLAAPAHADALDAANAASQHPGGPAHDPSGDAWAPAAERASKSGGLLSSEQHAALALAAHDLPWRATVRSAEPRARPLDR